MAIYMSAKQHLPGVHRFRALRSSSPITLNISHYSRQGTRQESRSLRLVRLILGSALGRSHQWKGRLTNEFCH